MHETYSVLSHGLMDEPARRRQVDEQVGVVDILDGNSEVPVAGRGVVRRYRLAPDRHYMGDPAFRQDSRGLGGVNPGATGTS